MGRFLARRIAFSLATLLVVVTVAFFMIRLAPGGPFDGERRLPPEVEANLRAAYDLDKPLIEQYVKYLGGVVRGDLGPSFRKKDFTVNDLIGAGLPASLSLGLAAIALAFGGGVLVGTLGALRKDQWLDQTLTSIATLGVALPPIVVAPGLLLVFAVLLRWFPAGGASSPVHFILPTIALALPYFAAFTRLTRGSVAETLTRDHVRTARAKGLGLGRIVRRHIWPTALIPVVSFLGPASATVLAGSMVVEQVFSIPGLGRYFVEGALNRDYTLVMGTVIVYASLVLGANLLVDLAYSRLDPRLRTTNPS